MGSWALFLKVPTCPPRKPLFFVAAEFLNWPKSQRLLKFVSIATFCYFLNGMELIRRKVVGFAGIIYRFLALLIQVGFAILFFSSNAIWDLIGIEEIEKIYRTVSNVIGAVLAVMAVYELVKIYLQFRVYGAI